MNLRTINMPGIEKKKNSRKEKLKNYIDLEMIPSKLTFFFTDGYFGSTVPFMNNFYTSLGLTATHAGMISGISLIVSSFFNPIWSMIADLTGHRKLIFIILCIGTGSTVFSMPWIEQAVAERNVTVACSNSTVNYTAISCTQSINLLNGSKLFKTMLILNIVAWIFYTSLRCYVDGTVTNVANTRTTKRKYGQQRCISCAGYAFFNLIAGLIADHYKPENMSPYTAIFYVFLPCIILMIPIGCVLINQTKWDQSERREETQKTDVIKEFLSLFKKLEFIVFLCSVLVEGIVLNVFGSFFFLLMEKEMNSSKTLMAFALVLGVVFETAMFATADKFIKLFNGTIISLIIGIFSFFPRFILMSYIENPWYILATQPLHGLGIGLAWTSIVEHTYEIVPSEIKVTAIAFMSSLVFFVSSAISNMIGGLFFEIYGGRVLFRYAGILAAVWSFIMTLFYGINYFVKSKTQFPTLVNKRPSLVTEFPEGITNSIYREEILV